MDTEVMTPQSTYNLITDILSDPTLPLDDRRYYENLRSDVYQQLAQQQQQQQQEQQQQQQQQAQAAMAGPSDYYDHNFDLVTQPAVQMPSPPLAEPSRKRNLGPTEYPEAKRVSAQPSPASSGSPVAPQWSLPGRPSKPMGYIDLTESNSPTPESSPERPQFQAFSDPFADPFAELDNAYRGDDGGLDPADAFNQDFMGRRELAEFMLAPTIPGASHAFQQPQAGVPLPNFGAYDSDSDEFGTISGIEADAIDKLLENVKEHGEQPEDRAPTPAMMTCTLKEYQRIGLSWLLKMENGSTKGGILADEMGLGKTIQALALICANPPTDPRHKTTLIIAPVALMRQWEKEIDRHVAPGHKLSVHLYHGSGKNVDYASLRNFDVVLTTFGCLTSEYKRLKSSKESMLREQEQRGSIQRKPKDRLALLGPQSMWHRVIIDEAHNIKNRKAQSSLACAELMAHHRLCLTGTPMMNSVEELYPLLRFLRVKHYENWPNFNKEIAKPVKMKHPATRKKAMNRVQIVIKSIMLRRQKDSKVDGKPVCTIPPKHTKVDVVEFTDDEHELYKALETKSQIQYSKYLQKGSYSSLNAIAVLTMLLRLRQACCHPHLIKDLSQPATDGIAEDDLLSRAQELNTEVIIRMKAFDSFECPICLEPDANPTIIIPCGHTVCGECVQKLIDPATRAQQDGNDESSTAKCPHCRGELKAKLITDYKHFCKVHCPERLEDEEEQEGGEAGDSDEDSDSEDDEDDAPDVDKKGNLSGFVVDDDVDDEYDDGEANDDTDLGSAPEVDVKSSGKKPKKCSKGKGKGKGKERAKPKQTLAQLKKESLRNKAAKRRYLRRLDKTYVPSAKIDRTVELIKEIRKNDPTEKTLVFSQFTSLLDLVEVPLHRERVRYQRYDGSMKMDDRAESVNAFMDDPNENVMLVSLKAGNAGLNLSKASSVIILDPFWNPFIEDQAVDRAHRMPQTREVTVYRLLVPETIEDRIIQLQNTKRETVDKALDEKDSKGLTRLNKQELKFLFGMN